MLGILGGDVQCPVARSLDVLGEKWTLMIVRDALLGATRFGQFRRSLGLPRDVLTARLSSLVESGVLVRTAYRTAGSRPRDEYVLTEAGRDLSLVLLALAGWADRHHPSEQGSDLRFVDRDTDADVHAAAVTSGDAAVPVERIVARSAVISSRWDD